jgi:hypothetical protein
MMAQPGQRIRLSGGYDAFPEWRAEQETHRDGTVVGFIAGQGQEPALVVQLDEPIVVRRRFRTRKGDIAILELRQSGATWTDSEVVHIEVCDFMPENKPWPLRRRGTWVESHATYRVL